METTTFSTPEKVNKETFKDERNEELLEQRELQGTPFTAVKKKDEDWNITFKNYIVKTDVKSYEECTEIVDGINGIPWDIISLMILYVPNDYKEFMKKMEEAIKSGTIE